MSLRVKRRKRNRHKVSDIEKVHDAYIIAVEDEAKKKLDRFTSDQQVDAVDMTLVPKATGSNIESSSSHSRPTGILQRQHLEVDLDNPLYQSVSTFIKHPDSMPGEKKKSSYGHSSPQGDPILSNGGSGNDSGEWVEMNGFAGDQESGKKGKATWPTGH